MIHSTAIIDPSAKIGKNVSIGPYAVIGPDVILHDGCQISSHAVIEYTELGENSRVFPFASLGLEPQHLKYKGEKTKVVTGARCVFREGSQVHRGTMLDKGVTTIGNDFYLMGLAHVAHDCQVGNNVIIVNASVLGGHAKIGNNVFISGLAGVHQFVRVGEGAMIGGAAMCVQDVAPYCIAQDDRAVLRGLNIVGMRRLGLKKENIKALKDAYRLIFQSQMTIPDVLASIEGKDLDPYAKKFFDFFREAKRGFTRPVGSATEEEEAAAV
jgi:UDP-N-acetylglucosamine acyltransferase